MSKIVKQTGEPNKYDLIRDILRDYASREKPISRQGIAKYARDKGCILGRTAIDGFMREMAVIDYETDVECDEILKEWNLKKREIILCKKGKKGRTIGYWMEEIISDSEWLFLLDSVLYSKILTKKEADNLAKRITLIAGKNLSELSKDRFRMKNQPYFVGDEKIDQEKGHIVSQVLRQVRLIREAMNMNPPRKVKFDLNVYKYGNQNVQLVPYGKFGRICSPYDIIYSNGRYYMLGADEKTERSKELKYKLYRIDLMTNLSITDKAATTKEAAGIAIPDLYRHRIENPYMFTGDVRRVRLRVDSDQFTQIVDWFSDSFKVVGQDADHDAYYDIELQVNLNSLLYWVLQYSGCVEVLETGKYGKNSSNKESFREKVKKTLKDALNKYEGK